MDSLPRHPPPCIYAGDFNCHSITWGYRNTNPDGTALEDWASASNLALLHDPKQPGSFHSARWGTTTNPDLAFANIGALSINRRVLEPFPKSQHRPSIIESSASINSVPTRPVKRWNFRKANWANFTETLNTAAQQPRLRLGHSVQRMVRHNPRRRENHNPSRMPCEPDTNVG